MITMLFYLLLIVLGICLILLGIGVLLYQSHMYKIKSRTRVTYGKGVSKN